MRRLWVVVLVIAAVVTWRVGVAHRATCISQGKVNCSLLPWSGSYPGAGTAGSGASSQGMGSGAQAVSSGLNNSVSHSANGVP